MSHFGFLSYPASGHLYPLTALARRLQQRGHRVTYFGVADAEPCIRAAGPPETARIERLCAEVGDEILGPPGTRPGA
jgi:UDP:flavonoid glycosyltransferase YjiC (YdhE family)